MGDLPSKLAELYIMDEGYKANAVASVGNTILAADTDHFDYQLVLASFEVSEAGEVELTSRNIILESQVDAEEYETMIYNVSASPDGYYYVLTGEAPRASLQIYTEKDSHEIKENPDYSGKYRIIRYSAEGELLDSLDIPSLPTDGPGVFMADKAGRLVIFGFTFEPYDDGDPYDTHTISSTSMFVVDFYTGEYETFRYGMNIVFSACPNGEKALVFADMMDEGTAGLYNVDLATGEFGRLDWEWTFGEASSTHRPICCQSGSGDVIVNNQTYYGALDPETFDFRPILNSIPEELPIIIEFENGPDFKDYPQFATCCRIGENTFIGIDGLNAPLYVVSPA